MSHFELTPEALSDLEEIGDFIAVDSPASALRILAEFERAFATLASRPHIGHRRRDLTSQDVLFWPLRAYLIIYTPSTKPLRIIAVLHGRRDLTRLL